MSLDILRIFFSAPLLFATYTTSTLLGSKTRLLGIPGITLFIYSFIIPENIFLQIATVIIFITGILVFKLESTGITLFFLASVAIFATPYTLLYMATINKLLGIMGIISGAIRRNINQVSSNESIALFFKSYINLFLSYFILAF